MGKDAAGVYGKMRVVVLEPSDPRMLEDSLPLLDRESYFYDDSENEDTIKSSIGDSRSLVVNKSLNAKKKLNTDRGHRQSERDKYMSIISELGGHEARSGKVDMSGTALPRVTQMRRESMDNSPTYESSRQRHRESFPNIRRTQNLSRLSTQN